MHFHLSTFKPDRLIQLTNVGTNNTLINFAQNAAVIYQHDIITTTLAIYLYFINILCVLTRSANVLMEARCIKQVNHFIELL